MNQQIRFCQSSDGTRIAYAVTGHGPLLLKAPHWFTHLEHEWQSPVWRPWIEALSRDYTVARMDERGSGLSDRDAEISFDALVRDLEAVAEAAGFERFALLGHSQGGPIAIEYAARHPERVNHLVLLGAYARGWLKRNAPPEVEQEIEARLKLLELSWERDEPSYRQLFASQFVPESSQEQLRSLSELARRSMTHPVLARLIHCLFNVDVRESAARVRCPALLLHAKGDLRVPFEEGRILASLIPGARLVPLDTANHVLLEGQPAFARFFAELRAFLPPSPAAEDRRRLGQLTGREVEILDLHRPRTGQFRHRGAARALGEDRAQPHHAYLRQAGRSEPRAGHRARPPQRPGRGQGCCGAVRGGPDRPGRKKPASGAGASCARRELPGPCRSPNRKEA
jgi:pimeloyl-ACP methyl ester carboxylesterase